MALLQLKGSGFAFSRRSRSQLATVDPRLAEVTINALHISVVDFGVTEGRRTLARQKKLLRQRKTKTLKSKHLDGLAVDVVAYLDGVICWDHVHYIAIANAFQYAACLHKVPIRWGGAWSMDAGYGRRTKIINDWPLDMAAAVDEYREWHGNPFIDMPHFEIYE